MRRRSHLSQESLLHLIDRAYAAVEDSAQWQQFLSDLTDTLAGTGALALHHDMHRSGFVASSVRLDPDKLDEYQQHYHRVDPWAISEDARRLAVPGAVLVDEACVDRTRLAKTEFYSFVRPQQLSRMVNVTLARDSRTASSFSIYRGDSDPAFDARECAFLQALAPHVNRAVRLRDEVQAYRSQVATALDTLSALDCAAFLLSTAGRVLSMNARAEALLSQGDVLRVDRGTLTMSKPQHRTRLQTLIAAAGAPDRTAAHTPCVLTVSRRDEPSIEVWVSPSSSEPSMPNGPSCVLLLATTAASDHRPQEALLRALHGLTRREAQVAAILSTGVSPDAVGDELRITRGTARWQTKQVMQKLGCRSRTELVRLLNRPLLRLTR